MFPSGPWRRDSPYDSPSTSAGNPLAVSWTYSRATACWSWGKFAEPRRLTEVRRCHGPPTRRFRPRACSARSGASCHASRGDLAHELGAFSRPHAGTGCPGVTLFPARSSALTAACLDRVGSRAFAAAARCDRAPHSATSAPNRVRGIHAVRLPSAVGGASPSLPRARGSLARRRSHVRRSRRRDVWEHRDIFQLDERGQRRFVAGVPPETSRRRATLGQPNL